MLLFDSGDPGGDAVIQRLYQACAAKWQCLYVGKNKNAYQNACKFSELGAEDLASCMAYIFSSNVDKKKYLNKLITLKKYDVTTVHILDSWSNYLDRFILNIDTVVLPDIYLVPDEYAKHEAVKAGIPSDILKIMGHPLFGQVSVKTQRYRDKLRILFVSEPIDLDNSKLNFNQFDIFDDLLIGCQQLEHKAFKKVEIDVKPHPRENFSTLAEHKFLRLNSVKLLESAIVDLAQYDIICGLNSILLYEAWLRNLSVFVPEKYVEYSHMKNRAGVQTDVLKSISNILICYHDCQAEATEKVRSLNASAISKFYEFLTCIVDGDDIR